MFAVGKLPCPRCKSMESGRHCHYNYQCKWRICNKCTKKNGTVKLVFDEANHSFEWAF